MTNNVTEVDMLAAARDAQWSADTFLGVGSVKVVAPAKVNLLLDVGARREDGYHEVSTVLHALSLHDVLYVNRIPAGQNEAIGEEADEYRVLAGPQDNLLVSVDCTDKTNLAGGTPRPLEVAVKDNIVYKAADALARLLDYGQRERIAVRLEKNIPHEGGLAGGSSDAAAMLVALAHFWGMSDETSLLHEAARQLGSDVAFFLHGGCAVHNGLGSTFERSLKPAKDAVVLVKPSVGVSTHAAYEAFDENPVHVPAEFVQRAHAATCADEVPLFNNLAAAAEGLAPELAYVRAWLADQQGLRDGSSVMLCGSGATTFAIMRDFSAASTVAAAAQARGWWARATTFSSLRAALRSDV